jgi:polar amino acid transport system permease protein
MNVELIFRTILAGLPTTVGVTVVAILVTTTVALPAGLARNSSRRLIRLPATVYVELFRGMSAYVWLFLVYYVLPLFWIQLDPFWSGGITMGLVGGAYTSEIVRGAIQAVPKGQTEAAIALNLPPRRRLTGVILPQAIVAMLPPLTNMYIMTLKGTSLVSAISLQEMVSRAYALRAVPTLYGQNIAIFGMLLLFYLVLALGVAGGMRLLENYLKLRWGLMARHTPEAVLESMVD